MTADIAILILFALTLGSLAGVLFVLHTLRFLLREAMDMHRRLCVIERVLWSDSEKYQLWLEAVDND